MKKYLSGLLVTMLLTFALTPVPDLITQILNALISAVLYILTLIILKISWPMLFQQKTTKWFNIVISVFSITITLIGFIVLNAFVFV